MDEFEQLTEEEMRQERERMRRRKLAARERRRKKRRQEAIIRCSILLIVVILILVGIIKGISGIFKHFHDKKVENQKIAEEMLNPTTEEPTTEEFRVEESILAKELPADREEALAILQEQAEFDQEIQSVYENAAVYTDRVLRNLAINEELKPFTVNYVTKINTVYDGDFLMEPNTSTGVPAYYQFDEKWGYADYGSSLLAFNGSAPTCVTMAYQYIKNDGKQNPITIGDYFMSMNYVDENANTSWDAFTTGIKNFGLTSDELSINEGNMKAALDEGKVIICCMDSGDFTKSTEHYIVVYGYDDYKFFVTDPFSEARSQIAWPFERLSTQIKNMWAISLGSEPIETTPTEDGTTGDDTTGDSTTNDGTTDDGSTDDTTTTNDTTDGTNNTDSSTDDASVTNTTPAVQE